MRRCGHDGILYINRLPIKAPKNVLEYAVAHELAHLKYRNHSAHFRTLVEKMICAAVAFYGTHGYYNAMPHKGESYENTRCSFPSFTVPSPFFRMYGR
ncbi:MAG: M48 metallopeptidase family protein [Spirochaetota bacterium]